MKLKRILSFILSICMIATLFVVPTFADGTSPFSFTVSATKVGVGDTVTVTISNTAMTTIGFAMYLDFDKDLLECTSVTGVDGDEYMGLYKTSGKFPFVEFFVCDSLNHPEEGDTINSDGRFSFGHVFDPATEILAGVTATLTFKAKANGTIEFKFYDANVDQLIQSSPVEVHTCSFEAVVATDNSNLVSAADCENAAVYEKICTCGATNGDTFVSGEALGHSYGEPVQISPADCENPEWLKKVCGTCGDETAPYEGTAALGHDHVAQLVSPADCENAAVYKDVCACGDVDGDPYSVGDPLGHDYQEQLVSPADCVNPEMSKNVCSRCGDETAAFETAPALGHNHVAQLVSPADCENAAVYKDVCACGDEEAPYSVGDPLGHDFSDEYNTTGEDTHWFDCANGCGTKNSEAPHEDADDDKICDVCGKELHKHSYVIKNSDDSGHWNECECGEIDPATGVIPHNFNIKKADSDSHWTACACGATTPAVAHTASDWIYDSIPTMNTSGHRHKECTGCGYVLASEKVDADVNWKDVTYVISATASEGGNVSPAGKSYVSHGSDVTYYFQANLGYEVAYVIIDGSYAGRVDSYTFNNVQASHSIFVVFKEIAPAYDDGYVTPPEIVIPEPSAPSEPAETDSKTYIAAVAKLAELKAVSTAGCTEASAAAFNAAVLALEIAVESHASDDVLIECVANAYLAKANLSIVKNPVTCDD